MRLRSSIQFLIALLLLLIYFGCKFLFDISKVSLQITILSCVKLLEKSSKYLFVHNLLNSDR